jgi:hypothetical protein
MLPAMRKTRTQGVGVGPPHGLSACYNIPSLAFRTINAPRRAARCRIVAGKRLHGWMDCTPLDPLPRSPLLRLGLVPSPACLRMPTLGPAKDAVSQPPHRAANDNDGCCSTYPTQGASVAFRLVRAIVAVAMGKWPDPVNGLCGFSAGRSQDSGPPH